MSCSQDSDVTVCHSSPSLLTTNNDNSNSLIEKEISISTSLINNNGAKHQDQLVSTTSKVNSLIHIQTEQKLINEEFELMILQQQPSNTYSSGTVAIEQLKKRLLIIETNLKDISHSNQRERKEIADILHRNGPSDTIKDRLVDLAQRQKILLACFKKQNELAKRSNSVAIETNKPPPTIRQTLPDPSQSGINNEVIISNSKTDYNSGLSQPVPLNVLINHGLLEPGTKLSCTLLGCNFEACLTRDGQLIEEGKSDNCTPQIWLTNCWLALGHTKKLNKRQVYKTINYKGVPLLSICEEYSRIQVTSYQQKLQKELHQKETQSQTLVQSTDSHLDIPTSTNTNTSSSQCTPDQYDLDSLLKNCRILPLPDSSSSFSISNNFWGNWSFEAESPLYYELISDLSQWPTS